MKRSLLFVTLIMMLTVLSGCGSEIVENSDGDSCLLRCDIGAQDYLITIPCESGADTTEYMSQTIEYIYGENGQTGMRLTLNQKRTYEETGNEYLITGYIELSEGLDPNYDILVTGGVYGEAGQTCQP